MASSANYLAESDKRQIEIGYFIEIEGLSKKFANVTISGVAAGDQEANIVKMSWNPPKISIDTVNVSVGTLTVELIDPNNTIMTHLQTNDILLKELTFKRGYGNLDVSDYNTLSVFRIYELSTNDQNRIVIKARDRIQDLKVPIQSTATTFLRADLTAAETTNVLVDSAVGFTSPGKVGIGNEVFDYSTADVGQRLLNALSGRDFGEDQDEGTPVYQAFVIQENPIDMLLKLMISPNGGITGSLYDDLDIGLSIDENQIDVAAFEDIRDNSTLTGDVWEFVFREEIPDALKFFQDEIFQFANVRIYINDEGKYSLSLFQEITLSQFDGPLEEENVLVIPKTRNNADRVINQITLNYSYEEQTGKYESQLVVNDAASQAKYGVKPGPKLSSKMIQSELEGESLMTQFANRYFRRVAEPFGLINSVKVLWKRQFFIPGSKATFTHSKVLDFSTGQVGVTDKFVEIISPKYDFDRGTVTYTLNNSPNLSDRWGFISPASNVASAASASVFTLESGEGARGEWEAGQEIALWLKEGGTAPISTDTILSVSTDTITLTSGFSITPTTAHQIKYADYDDVTDDQKLFGFFTDDNNNFGDGKAAYKIS